MKQWISIGLTCWLISLVFILISILSNTVTWISIINAFGSGTFFLAGIVAFVFGWLDKNYGESELK
jgi:hypothetical protein